MSNVIDHYVNELDASRDSLPGSELGWLSEARDSALQEFRTQGFPSLRTEDWKYTSIRPIEKRQFKLARDAGDGIDLETLHRYTMGIYSHLLVFVDGRYSAPLSSHAESPEGLIIKDLSRALREDAHVLQAHLGSAVDVTRNGFVAMNTAFMSDGAFIELKDSCVVEQPIHLMFLSTGQHQEVTSQARILIVADTHSQAKIIESYHSLQDNVYFNNVTTEIKLGQGANIEHYKLQEESKKAFHIATLQVDQQRDSTFTSHSISLGSQLARNDINSWMADEGATCNLYGLYVADGRQHTDFHTRIDHAKPHCTSNEFYKGILDGHSRAVFNGQVHVHSDAQKSDAQQANNNLLLSRDAEVDTKPQLEIYADDVTAAHGATVGQLDEGMMFYLRSRGIDYNAAHALLVYGFAHSVIENMSLEPIRKYIESVLVNRIPNAAQFSDMLEK